MFSHACTCGSMDSCQGEFQLQDTLLPKAAFGALLSRWGQRVKPLYWLQSRGVMPHPHGRSPPFLKSKAVPSITFISKTVIVAWE